MYTMEMTFTPSEDPKNIGEVNFEIVPNEDGTVSVPSKEEWDTDLTNDLVNILQKYPNLKKIRFEADGGEKYGNVRV